MSILKNKQPDSSQIELLRMILENSLQPRRLDTHPWMKSLVVAQALRDLPELKTKSPGQQLLFAIVNLFKQMMPSTPPRKGKRLDTRWAEFGLLAAQYFSPLIYGEPAPASLRDAWGYIDRSILLFVYGKNGPERSLEEKAAYGLVSAEPSVAAISTLSDWNRNGLRRFLGLIASRESHLAESLGQTPLIVSPLSEEPPLVATVIKPVLSKAGKRIIWASLGVAGLALLILVIFGGIKASRIYQSALVLRQDAQTIQSDVKSDAPFSQRIRSAADLFTKMDQDYEALLGEARPFLWMGPWLGWVPKYGGDLAAAPRLVSIADPLMAAANTLSATTSPLLDGGSLDHLSPLNLTRLLIQERPAIEQARRQVDQAVAARQQLRLEKLSPSVRQAIQQYLDPILPLLQDGLTAAVEFPRLAGGSDEGPKTYLLLVQNEDELRPTGGFITAAGTLLLQDGKIGSLTFENSGDMDDWTKPYPAAPWQMQQYMNSAVMVFRDTNWFTNYPAAAQYAERLYSYVNDHSVDGVIAFDQQMLVELLAVTGPVKLEGVSYPIDSSNVIQYMRTAKVYPGDSIPAGWDYKFFMKQIADALAEKIYAGTIPIEKLAPAVYKILNEHHMLIQVDNAQVASLMEKYHWDGSLRPEAGDFLMLVDSNVGFNKTNAVVKTKITYDIDLTTPLMPASTLTIDHSNAAPELICKQWDKIRRPGEDKYPISDCYWNYMRVYVPAGAQLLDSSTQSIPAYWMIIKTDIPAHVDTLDEGIKGVQAFGTLQVVPGGEARTTSLHFALPSTILIQPAPNQFTYRLKIQKQPGTNAVPITIRFHLPGGALIENRPAGSTMQNNSIFLETTLDVDRLVEVEFRLP
jgi:hypothetical protein